MLLTNYPLWNMHCKYTCTYIVKPFFFHASTVNNKLSEYYSVGLVSHKQKSFVKPLNILSAIRQLLFFFYEEQYPSLIFFLFTFSPTIHESNAEHIFKLFFLILYKYNVRWWKIREANEKNIYYHFNRL